MSRTRSSLPLLFVLALQTGCATAARVESFAGSGPVRLDLERPVVVRTDEESGEDRVSLPVLIDHEEDVRWWGDCVVRAVHLSQATLTAMGGTVPTSGVGTFGIDNLATLAPTAVSPVELGPGTHLLRTERTLATRIERVDDRPVDGIYVETRPARTRTNATTCGGATGVDGSGEVRGYVIRFERVNRLTRLLAPLIAVTWAALVLRGVS